jgi:DNA-binding GntR family transcriptional regulator
VSESAAHARLFAGLLGEAGTATTADVAHRAGISTAAAGETLSALERGGLIERMHGDAYRAARLDAREARELYPVVLLLEATAVREAPSFDDEALGALKAANARLRETTDARTASLADDAFHRALTAGCGNARLLAVLDPVRRALLAYEEVYMDAQERRERSAAQHDAIVAALEAGDRHGASMLVRENFTSALGDLTEALEQRRRAD